MTTRFRPKKEDITSTTKSNISKKFVVADHLCTMTEKTCTIPVDVVDYIMKFIPKCSTCDTYDFRFKEGYLCIECQEKRLLRYLKY